jgi:NADH:ubiquinone oxidoreductase subunit 6 (subunit J)
VRYRPVIAAIGALALIAAPTSAMAQQAASATAAQAEPATETVEGSQVRGGILLPAFLLAAIIAAILLLLDKDKDPPQSP